MEGLSLSEQWMGSVEGRVGGVGEEEGGGTVIHMQNEKTLTFKTKTSPPPRLCKTIFQNSLPFCFPISSDGEPPTPAQSFHEKPSTPFANKGQRNKYRSITSSLWWIINVCMCVCMNACIYVRICAYVRENIYAHIYTCTHYFLISYGAWSYGTQSENRTDYVGPGQQDLSVRLIFAGFRVTMNTPLCVSVRMLPERSAWKRIIYPECGWLPWAEILAWIEMRK